MKKLVVLSCALAALVSAALACEFGGALAPTPESTSTPTPKPTRTPGPTPTPLPLRAAGWEETTVRTLCLEVEQSYPQIGEEFSLPLAEDVRSILTGLGLQVVTGGAPCEATLTFVVAGQALGARYAGAGPRDCYSGAEFRGQVSLVMPGREPLTLPVFGRIVTPQTITSCPREPKHAPFGRAWWEALLDGLTPLWGPRVIIQAACLDAEGYQGYKLHEAVREALRERGPEVIPVLIQALGDGDANVRCVAARALADKGPEAGEAVPALIEALSDEAPLVRNAAAWALGEMGPAEGVVPALIEALGDDNAEVRGVAALALGEMGPAEGVVPALIEALGHDDANVRDHAAHSLGRMGPQEGVVPALIQALSDESSLVRTEVARALKEISGQDFGQDAARWLEWWEEQQ